MFLNTWIFLLAHVTVASFEQQGVALIEQLQEGDSQFEIKFVRTNANDPVQVYSSFSLPDQLTASWQIHYLPVKMGSETCSELELGGCFECNEEINPDLNNPTQTRPVCIKGNPLGHDPTNIPKCAQIKGKDGLVGRSIVVRIRHNSPNQPDKVYCATIYDQNSLRPNFMSTIAWFDSPLTGFVAFRKESLAVSYIIVNLTRTVDNRERLDEDLKWEIRGENIHSRDSLYNPDLVLTEDAKYNENCDPSSDTGHQSCAAGDLWKKHGRLELKNNMEINLKMFVDNNLASETLSLGQHLVILNTTSKSNGTTEKIVAWSRIEGLAPLSSDISFLDGSVLKLLQRDDWSPIQQSYQSAHQNTPGKWEVSIYELPPIQIFGGDQWDCDEITTSKGWSPISRKMFPPFKTSREERPLNQTYTLYGRNSMMYRGVAIRPENDVKFKCATITYKQGEERISYSLLEPTAPGMMDQRVIVLMIEHMVVRQTTVLMATLCRSSMFFLDLTERDGCQGDKEPYNPFGVCPAYCPLTGEGMSCERKCHVGDLYNNCCTMCVYDSSFLCPVGDLRRRLDVFQPNTRNHYTNRETVFSVKNEVNLPLNQINNKFIGVHVFAPEDALNRVLMRCGIVKELTETVVTLEKPITDGKVMLTQRTAWQPITVTYEGIKVTSLEILDTPNFASAHVCKVNSSANQRPFYREDFSDDRDAEETTSFVKRSITLENYKEKIPTFFGKESIIGKSLKLVYKTKDGHSETTKVDIRPEWAPNATKKLEAVLVDGPSQRVLRFNFEQRRGHLAADTYVRVEVLSKKYCGKEIKWYLVSNTSIKYYKAGQLFTVKLDDGKTLKGAHNKQQSCSRTPSQYPYNLNMGDLSGILGDVNLDGPGRVYVHESLPLLEGNTTKNIRPTRKNNLNEVEGHYLLVADVNNTIIDTILLLPPDDPTHTPTVTPHKDESKNTLVIVVVVVVGLAFIISGSYILYRILLKTNNGKDSGFRPIPQDPHRPPPHGQLKLFRNKRTHQLCYIHSDGTHLYMLKTSDAKTGAISLVHHDDLEKVNPEDLHQHPNIMRYNESNGSTNGSSLTRSRGTVAEENLYTTVSPTAGHPNNIGSLIASPESSSSSLSSHTVYDQEPVLTTTIQTRPAR
ncbi:uncharacterized protein LOC134811618 isoform X4 [Bolinopsis microptera]|uniref:uncharacterized protein LOC134811618 isoform X4 n=1 Tax=Bolinopsis microptera TaxID=2820187 RepID=UPI003079DA7A